MEEVRNWTTVCCYSDSEGCAILSKRVKATTKHVKDILLMLANFDIITSNEQKELVEWEDIETKQEGYDDDVLQATVRYSDHLITYYAEPETTVLCYDD